MYQSMPKIIDRSFYLVTVGSDNTCSGSSLRFNLEKLKVIKGSKLKGY